ncbi:PEBP-like protein [Fomitiporia mediterranea MF3/22]|uniref:PEBP-like protein n=1 Tax=Fomitiporia mediterranea (strain MF3/22) TaxID=694068 RepID=UPI0004409C29|nr:PEBP-like protein [Fomitiporia mediterranea MF3/22]EJD03667.1 PEBP-like protein [Fomitiporia mediterranea MF3/22]
MLAARSFAHRRFTPLLARANASLTTNTAVSNNTLPPELPLHSDVKSKNPSTDSGSGLAASSTSTGADKAATTPNINEKAEGGEGVRGRRRRRVVKRRPPISLTNPRKWNPPVKPGSLPVYDEALKLIQEDSVSLKRDLKTLRARVTDLEKDTASLDAETEKELQALKEKANVLEIQSEINLPWVRWYAANGMADLTKPVYRRLVEHKWRNYGGLDLLMERIHQMHVVPDLLPSVHPSIDLRVSFPEPPPLSTYLRTRTRRKYKPVEPGVYLLPEQTRRAPRLYTSVFHPETRYYTLVLIDADVPDPENSTFTTYLHWLQPNIALSSASCGHLPTIPHTKYIPPHPQRGSPYHRYCLFLLPHVNASEKLSIPSVSDEARIGFDVRAFCEEHGLDASQGGGAHMWREVWNEAVTDIYKHTLKQPEPRYGLPPRADPYADVKTLRKFSK